MACVAASHMTTTNSSGQAQQQNTCAEPAPTWKMRRFCLLSGSGNSILRSRRPGRSSAGSRVSALLVAMITCGGRQQGEASEQHSLADTRCCHCTAVVYAMLASSWALGSLHAAATPHMLPTAPHAHQAQSLPHVAPKLAPAAHRPHRMLHAVQWHNPTPPQTLHRSPP
jgi:hypothetical protein